MVIPTVPTAQEVLDKAFRKASMVQVADRDAMYRMRKTAVARVTSVADTVDHVLGRTVRGLSVLDGLHPFYVEVLWTQFDVTALRRAVANLDWCRGQVREVVQKAVKQLNRTRNRAFIDTKRKEVYGRVSSLLERLAPELEMLGRARDALRALPAIDPKVPTVVVAGYPNVGKSALVGRLSTAEPEVASYPFTTTKVTLGHFFSKGLAYQVVDTPGILDRPIEERNPVERRALAAIAHLPNVLLFLIDPTGTGGTTVAMQEGLLEEVRAAYPGADVVAVETKADIVRREGVDRPRVSSVTGEGVEELRAELIRRLPRAEVEWVIREG
jgi:nucleolar GTP-binding protein